MAAPGLGTKVKLMDGARSDNCCTIEAEAEGRRSAGGNDDSSGLGIKPKATCDGDFSWD